MMLKTSIITTNDINIDNAMTFTTKNNKNLPGNCMGFDRLRLSRSRQEFQQPPLGLRPYTGPGLGRSYRTYR